jgi:hypothetical protein
MQRTGGWRGESYKIYQRPDFSMSDRCAATMHDKKSVDLSLLRYVHSTPGNSVLPTLYLPFVFRSFSLRFGFCHMLLRADSGVFLLFCALITIERYLGCDDVRVVSG